MRATTALPGEFMKKSQSLIDAFVKQSDKTITTDTIAYIK